MTDHLPTPEAIEFADKTESGRREFENAMHMRALGGRRFDVYPRIMQRVIRDTQIAMEQAMLATQPTKRTRRNG